MCVVIWLKLQNKQKTYNQLYIYTMSEAEDRETNEQLATRIQQAIRGVTERIQGYVQDVDRFSGEYNAEVERLQQLIQRLRE